MTSQRGRRVATNDDGAVFDPKRIQKRQRDREKKRVARQEYLDEIKVLSNTILQMTAQVAALTAQTRRKASTSVTSMLSWEEVAWAMRDHVHCAVTSQHFLRKELDATKQFAALVRVHLDACQPIPMAPLYSSSSWRDTALFHGEDLRRTGSDWITSSSMMAMPPLLTSGGLADDKSEHISVWMEGDIVRMQILTEVVYPASLDDTTARVWALQAGKAEMDPPAVGTTHTVLEVVDNDIAYTRSVMPRGTVQSLCRVYREPTRSTMVCVAILHDDDFPYAPDDYKPDNKTWYSPKLTHCLEWRGRVTVHATSPQTSVVRQLMRLSQPILDRDTVMPVAEFAAIVHKKVFGTVPARTLQTDDDCVRLIRRCLVADHAWYEERLRLMVYNVRMHDAANGNAAILAGGMATNYRVCGLPRRTLADWHASHIFLLDLREPSEQTYTFSSPLVVHIPWSQQKLRSHEYPSRSTRFALFCPPAKAHEQIDWFTNAELHPTKRPWLVEFYVLASDTVLVDAKQLSLVAAHDAPLFPQPRLWTPNGLMHHLLRVIAAEPRSSSSSAMIYDLACGSCRDIVYLGEELRKRCLPYRVCGIDHNKAGLVNTAAFASRRGIGDLFQFVEMDLRKTELVRALLLQPPSSTKSTAAAVVKCVFGCRFLRRDLLLAVRDALPRGSIFAWSHFVMPDDGVWKWGHPTKRSDILDRDELCRLFAGCDYDILLNEYESDSDHGRPLNLFIARKRVASYE
ncbi:Aste57867_11539 [Aphanomyces stellatus]|uniref:Aste57867_11539 protein n=1 Tax=Aphanomyces stellatus TaxID=120398 RepID=A0A485KTS3_9STRA|nr:hypothetical protein As57867_011496 [Aphanomyces stellatus]VFT88400.1 Aste57867_11539 [Aphanomyces stellatus]